MHSFLILAKVAYRLTYDDVEEMVSSGLAGTDEEWGLGRLSELAQLRYKYRCSKGSVDQFEKGLDHVVKVTRRQEKEKKDMGDKGTTLFDVFPMVGDGVYLSLARDISPLALVTPPGDACVAVFRTVPLSRVLCRDM